jgi:hypothetical protein
MVSTESEIHPLLEACPFSAAHLDVGDDVIAHKSYLDTGEILFSTLNPYILNRS